MSTIEPGTKIDTAPETKLETRTETEAWNGQPVHPEIEVRLVGTDGNAFSILGKVSNALKEAGYTDDAAKFMEEATAGDYDQLLATAMRWVSVA